jgi:hypothetical protein
VPTLGTLGVICRRQGKLAEARRLYDQALMLLAGRVTAAHPYMKTLQQNVANLDAALGDRHAREAFEGPQREGDPYRRVGGQAVTPK